MADRILAVMAHPDDVDFGCAGSMATWTAEGKHVAYCIVTDGDAGGFDHDITRPDMAKLRRAEQRAAAKTVGVENIYFLGYPDGQLTCTYELRRDISRIIRQEKPQRVVTQSPERNWERIYASHPDHMAAGEAALCAVYPDARNPFAHPELIADGLEPHVVEEVWLAAAGNGDAHVDITEVFDKKLAALKCHNSQVAHMDNLEEMLRQWAGFNAKSAGWPEGRLAETYKKVNTA